MDAGLMCAKIIQYPGTMSETSNLHVMADRYPGPLPDQLMPQLLILKT